MSQKLHQQPSSATTNGRRETSAESSDVESSQAKAFVRWTKAQERALLDALSRKHGYQSALVHLWYPPKPRNTIDEIDSNLALRASDHDVRSALRDLTVDAFKACPARDGKDPKQVREKLRSIRDQYCKERDQVQRTPNCWVGRDFVDVGKYHWWDRYKKIVIAHDLRLKQNPFSCKEEEASEDIKGIGIQRQTNCVGEADDKKGNEVKYANGKKLASDSATSNMETMDIDSDIIALTDSVKDEQHSPSTTEVLSRNSTESSAVAPSKIIFFDIEKRDMVRLFTNHYTYLVILLDDFYPSSPIPFAKDRNRAVEMPSVNGKTLRAMIAESFSRKTTRGRVNALACWMVQKYRQERRKLNAESQNMLLSEITGHGDDEIRLALGDKHFWWEPLHELAIAHERRSKQAPVKVAGTGRARPQDSTHKLGQQQAASAQLTEDKQDEEAIEVYEENDVEPADVDRLRTLCGIQHKEEKEIYVKEHGNITGVVFCSDNTDDDKKEEGAQEEEEEEEEEKGKETGKGKDKAVEEEEELDNGLCATAVPNADDMDLDSDILEPTDDYPDVQLATQDDLQNTAANGTIAGPSDSKALVLRQKVAQTPRKGRSSRHSTLVQDKLQFQLGIEEERTKQIELKLEAKAKERDRVLSFVTESMPVADDETRRALFQLLNQTFGSS